MCLHDFVTVVKLRLLRSAETKNARRILMVESHRKKKNTSSRILMQYYTLIG